MTMGQQTIAFDVFMALANLARELVPLRYSRSIEDVWFAYRDHLAVADRYRERPEWFAGYAQIDGLQHVMTRPDTGGVIALLHFGDYRFGPVAVSREIREQAPDIPLAVVMDQESYDAEARLPAWMSIWRDSNVEILIAESPQIGMQIMRHLRRGGWIFVYLDGNRGAGTDASPLEIEFLSSRIQMRSGLFRLLARTGSRLVPMVTDREDGTRPRATLYPAIAVPADAPGQGLQACFVHFRKVLLRQPELWRFWFRHHHQVVHWPPLPVPRSPAIVDWRCDEVTPPIGLSVSSGRVFRIS
jgi:lauroyl/myristoyl acyltransferase